MKKQSRKEKQKIGEIAKALRTTVVEVEGSSTGVSEKGKTIEIDLTNLKKKEWDKDWKTYLEAQARTYGQI